MLLGINAMVSSIEYIHDAFRDTKLERVFTSGLITTFNVVAVICAVLATLSGSKKYVHDAPMQGSDTTSWDRIVSVQKRIVTWSASLFGLFLVTLTVYPGLTSRVRTLTQVPWLQNPSVFVAWHMVAMNTGDLLGRRLPVLLPWLNVRDSRIALGTTLLRTLYVPAAVACHVRSDQTQSFSDTFFFVMVFTLGLTSGLLSTSFLVSGPQWVHGSSGVCMEDVTLLHEQPESQAPNVVADEDAAIASMLLSFWLVCGLAVGAFVSLVANMLMG
ncbi:hypothetical protein MEQU1_000095 [Malassezia equina]|uniref:Uncharacterized protein n=1 Tax=Malassezia equina TaxID=1381935 RepID=A0AAF0EB91_9BASI|nr:hypothetical protein MEQU1_000095 [Malassezia equina]